MKKKMEKVNFFVWKSDHHLAASAKVFLGPIKWYKSKEENIFSGLVNKKNFSDFENKLIFW